MTENQLWPEDQQHLITWEFVKDLESQATPRFPEPVSTHLKDFPGGPNLLKFERHMLVIWYCSFIMCVQVI